MKKTLFIVVASLLIVCAGVLAFLEARGDSEPKGKSLNDYIIEDYHSVVDTLSDTTSVFFYEVETVLNGTVDSLDCDEIRVVDYTMVIQTEMNTHFIHRNLDSNSRYVETVYGDTWGGCFAIDSAEFDISFEEAVHLVKHSKYPTPDTKFMTLRRPLGIRYAHPIYIFGNSRNEGLCVDSKNGNVKKFI